MTEDTTEQKLVHHISQLEIKLKEALDLLNLLAEENQSLKVREDQLLKERSILYSKNDKVRLQVEAMIQRLKSMDDI